MAFNDGLNGVFFNDVLLWWFNGYIHGCSLRESNVAMDNSPLIAKKKPPLRDDFRACPVGLPEANA